MASSASDWRPGLFDGASLGSDEEAAIEEKEGRNLLNLRRETEWGDGGESGEGNLEENRGRKDEPKLRRGEMMKGVEQAMSNSKGWAI